MILINNRFRWVVDDCQSWLNSYQRSTPRTLKCQSFIFFKDKDSISEIKKNRSRPWFASLSLNFSYVWSADTSCKKSETNWTYLKKGNVSIGMTHFLPSSVQRSIVWQIIADCHFIGLVWSSSFYDSTVMYQSFHENICFRNWYASFRVVSFTMK